DPGQSDPRLESQGRGLLSRAPGIGARPGGAEAVRPAGPDGLAHHLSFRRRCAAPSFAPCGRRMNLRLVLSLLLGLAILVAVLIRFDLSLVLDVFRRVGFGGFALIVLAGLAAEIVLAVGIYPFLPRLLPLSIVAASRQLRDSSADVLPITQLGGVVLA